MSLFNLAVLISGSGTNLQAVIDAVEGGIIPNARLVPVISDREGVFGLERAKKHNIDNMVINKNDTALLHNTLKSYNTDGIVLAGYLSILPPEIISTYDGKIINIHPALLPDFGGKGFYEIKVHQAVLASGEKVSGATAHLVDNGIDTGPVLVRGTVPVLPDDTAESLQKRVLEKEHIVLVRAVKALADGEVDSLKKNPLTLQ
ncbi:MAG: phosphoribosylglycinamide formyltransferase [Oscillospiraceae bacterium]|nr:phosphoribosylglycinamide formyltransferase [Oscillospiraceae bacterium]